MFDNICNHKATVTLRMFVLTMEEILTKSIWESLFAAFAETQKGLFPFW